MLIPSVWQQPILLQHLSIVPLFLSDFLLLLFLDAFVHHNKNRRQNTKGIYIGGGENHEGEEEEKKRKKIEEHYTRRLNTAALCLSGSLLNKSRYLSSHGDQIGNAGQTRRRGALRRRSTQTYILYRIKSERAV